MANLEISDLPAGFDLLSDEESFLNELDDSQESSIYGGSGGYGWSHKYQVLTIYTAPIGCGTIIPLPTPPEPEPHPLPDPLPTPPVIQPPYIQMTPPEILEV